MIIRNIFSKFLYYANNRNYEFGGGKIEMVNLKPHPHFISVNKETNTKSMMVGYFQNKTL